MMKRITAALLAAALFLTLTGCADASERQSRKTALRILRGDDLGYHLSTGTAVENQEVYKDVYKRQLLRRPRRFPVQRRSPTICFPLSLTRKPMEGKIN